MALLKKNQVKKSFVLRLYLRTKECCLFPLFGAGSLFISESNLRMYLLLQGQMHPHHADESIRRDKEICCRPRVQKIHQGSFQNR